MKIAFSALTKTPGIDRLSDLPREDRLRYPADVDLPADAVETVCRRADPAFRRLNIEILGNTDAFLHCHIWPRYEWEPPEIVGKPVWLYGAERWGDPATAPGSAHAALRAQLTAEVFRGGTRWSSGSTSQRCSGPQVFGVPRAAARIAFLRTEGR